VRVSRVSLRTFDQVAAKLGNSSKGKTLHVDEAPLPAPTYLVIIGHALYSPWLEILLEGQLQTWVKAEDDRILHAHGKTVGRYLHQADEKYWQLKWSKKWGRLVYILERMFLPLLNKKSASVTISQSSYGFKSLTVDMPDLNLMMNRKSLAVFNFAANSNYDFVVITTSSSYLNLKNLEEALGALPRKNLVAGRILEQHAIKFPSGSFRIFTPDVLKCAIEIRALYKYWVPEDLALGQLLQNLDLVFVDLPSIDVPTIDVLNSLDSERISKNIHFRLKNEIDGVRTDVETMRALHKIIVGLA
jgi:hypothetical protein